MKCDIACKCGQLKGTCEVLVGKDLRSFSTYKDITGQFTLKHKPFDKGMLFCTFCGKAALTVGEWS